MPPADDVWLVLPSANPECCAQSLPRWRERGYRIAVLQDRRRFPTVADAVLEVDEYRGWPWAINTLCREVVPSSCRVVVAAGDDMLPDPGHTAGELAREYLDRFPDGFGVMQPAGDRFLHSHTYCGSPWFGRGWIERAFGGHAPIPRWYTHNWADMELCWVARGLGRLWVRPDVTQRHEHFSRGRGGRAPAYWTDSAGRSDLPDALTFSERAWAGFPGCEPSGDDDQTRYDHNAFLEHYTSIAEIHLHRLTGRAAFDAQRRVREAVAHCRDNGWTRWALYGNGAHTDAVWDALENRPVAVLDDRAEPGAHRDGVPVLRPEDVVPGSVDAVILSANSIEDDLVARGTPPGVPVIRLYGARSPRIVTPDRSLVA
ncbi:MAG: nucleoside-diphosphate sugar epimerase/dehydratase [Phycisphaerales bacterium JB040]